MPVLRLKGMLGVLLMVCCFLLATASVQASAEEAAGKRTVKTIVVDDYYPYTFVNDQGQPDG